MKKIKIGVIGYADERFINKNTIKACKDVGKEISKHNAILITGGLGGIMKYVSEGAKSCDGTTVGIVPLSEKNKVNDYIDISIIGNDWGIRNNILVYSSDAVIVIGGGSGTLNEISLAYMLEKPIVALKGTGGWGEKLAKKFLDERKKVKIGFATTPKNAVETAIRLAKFKNENTCHKNQRNVNYDEP